MLAQNLGLPLLRFHEEELHDYARQRTGLSDFGEQSYREGLSVLLDSIRYDAKLSPLGGWLIREYTRSALEKRLLLIDYQKRHSDQVVGKLNRPIIVAGLPRSGTTHLHRLLAALPNSRPIPMWELVSPLPTPGRIDQRRRRIWLRVELGRRLAPGVDAKHNLRADTPEECVPLFDSTFVSLSFWMFWPVYGYLDWYLEQDKIEAYRQYRAYLTYFQRREPNKRLVLKAPVHSGAIGELLEVIPEAIVIQTHRDPVKIVPSVCSLLTTVHSAMTEEFQSRRLIETCLSFMDWAIEKNMAARSSLLKDPVFDVPFKSIVRDPVDVLRAIHKKFDIPFSTEDANRVASYQTHNPQHRHGKHSYSATDFGLTDQTVAERYQDYRSRFCQSS